ncbi:hypothetical protein AK812_SmicGene34999 [Symbiodinium microadriaticum]|uniref:Uncharacterized protein n=1 Tax=Symbiodinium microadriaticum TaxID=2951 RepID=A0A1Q9CML6_SYMMI|nr:hypothetical protein AK812_SmicGene34999 [Symbiodinium microadriaticum]
MGAIAPAVNEQDHHCGGKALRTPLAPENKLKHTLAVLELKTGATLQQHVVELKSSLCCSDLDSEQKKERWEEEVEEEEEEQEEEDDDVDDTTTTASQSGQGSLAEGAEVGFRDNASVDHSAKKWASSGYIGPGPKANPPPPPPMTRGATNDAKHVADPSRSSVGPGRSIKGMEATWRSLAPMESGSPLCRRGIAWTWKANGRIFLLRGSTTSCHRPMVMKSNRQDYEHGPMPIGRVAGGTVLTLHYARQEAHDKAEKAHWEAGQAHEVLAAGCFDRAGTVVVGPEP